MHGETIKKVIKLVTRIVCGGNITMKLLYEWRCWDPNSFWIQCITL